MTFEANPYQGLNDQKREYYYNEITKYKPSFSASPYDNLELEYWRLLNDGTIPRAREVGAYYMSRTEIVEGVDNRDAIQAIITKLSVSAGIKHLVLPPGEITLGRQLTIPSTCHNFTLSGHGDDTVIKQVAGAVNKALIYGTGSIGTKVPLTSDLTAGSTSIQIPISVASTLVVGSIIGLECTDIVYGIGSASQEGYAGEQRKVLSVVDTTVNIEGPLLHNYPVSSSAVAWKIEPLRGLTVKNLTFTSLDPLVYRGRALGITLGQGFRAEGIRMINSGGGIQIMDTFDSYCRDIEVDGLPNYDGAFKWCGYGIVTGGASSNSYIENLRGRNFRHLFTTLADERTVGETTTQWAGPRHVTIRGGAGEQARTGTNYSIWDTHPYGYDIVFDQCRAFGGSSSSSNGFQIRSKNTRLINPFAKWSGNQGIRFDPVATEGEIIGGEVSFSGSGGVSLSKNTQLKGTWIHDNTNAGVTIGDSSGGSIVSDCKLEENTYGVHDQSTGLASGIVIKNNIIPKSVKQVNSILSPKSNLIFAQNITKGYGASLDGAGGSIGGSVIRSQNLTD